MPLALILANTAYLLISFSVFDILLNIIQTKTSMLMSKILDHFGGFIFGVIRAAALTSMICFDLLINLGGSIGQFIFNAIKSVIGALVASYKVVRDNLFGRNLDPEQPIFSFLVNAVEFLVLILPLLLLESAMRIAGSSISMLADWTWGLIVAAASIVTAPFLSIFDGTKHGVMDEMSNSPCPDSTVTTFYELYFSQQLPMNSNFLAFIFAESAAAALVYCVAMVTRSVLTSYQGHDKEYPSVQENSFLAPIRPRALDEASEEIIDFSHRIAYRS